MYAHTPMLRPLIFVIAHIVFKIICTIFSAHKTMERISKGMSADTSESISRGISEGQMPEQKTLAKWSIRCLWEHFLVPEHQIPIWY